MSVEVAGADKANDANDRRITDMEVRMLQMGRNEVAALDERR